MLNESGSVILHMSHGSVFGSVFGSVSRSKVGECIGEVVCIWFSFWFSFWFSLHRRGSVHLVWTILAGFVPFYGVLFFEQTNASLCKSLFQVLNRRSTHKCIFVHFKIGVSSSQSAVTVDLVQPQDLPNDLWATAFVVHPSLCSQQGSSYRRVHAYGGIFLSGCKPQASDILAYIYIRDGCEGIAMCPVIHDTRSVP
jgi:hypothetical protein